MWSWKSLTVNHFFSTVVLHCATVPTLVSNVPANLSASGQTQLLSLYATDLIAPLSIRFDGALLAANPTSTTQVDVTVPASLLTNIRTVLVSAEVTAGTSNALKAGNVKTALTFLTTGVQEKYQPVFEGLIADMPTIVASYSRPIRGHVTEGLAEYAIMRNIASEGGMQVFFIHFLKDANGKWLVDSM